MKLSSAKNLFFSLLLVCGVVSASEMEVKGNEAWVLGKRLVESGAKKSIEKATENQPKKIVYQVNYLNCSSIPGTFLSDRCVFQDQNNENASQTVLPGDARRLFKALADAQVHVRSYSDGFGGGEIHVYSVRCEIPVFLGVFRGAASCKIVQ